MAHLMPKISTFVLFAMVAATPCDAVDLTVRVLDRDGRPLRDAVVVTESTQTGPRPTPPAEHTIVQERMKFVPAVSVVHRSTAVRFVNQDTWDHHVKGGVITAGNRYTKPEEGFAMRLAGRVASKPASSQVQTFTEAGPQLLGCHLHGSMQGHVYVTESPWSSVSDADGRVRLTGLPYGPARVLVWHPDGLVDTPPTTVTLSDGLGVVSINTQVLPRRRRAEPEPMPGY